MASPSEAEAATADALSAVPRGGTRATLDRLAGAPLARRGDIEPMVEVERGGGGPAA